MDSTGCAARRPTIPESSRFFIVSPQYLFAFVSSFGALSWQPDHMTWVEYAVDGALKCHYGQ
ncbi:hypothetical protein MSSD14B_12810 [Marinobacter salsuginis]|uniref:Uncharacterized protein n=1 Tax=Marinobacter salsuginis TaxID=418719 RepID=A0A5M3PXM0_9GAMM|nr:hypothetical protein MSSD14B_12810 [Marinobacter salsuginis]